MEKQEKEILEVKKDIAKRLWWSNKELWQSLSEAERMAVVDLYYHTYDIENAGILYVLDGNRNLRRSAGFLLLGLLLGVFGGAAGNIFLKYLPQNGLWDVLVVLAFFCLLYLFIYFIEKQSAQNLGEDRVLEHLLKLVKDRQVEESIESENHNKVCRKTIKRSTILPMTLKIKRIYEPAAASDGVRVLADRLWPRGVSKEGAKIDVWAKELSPSDELRKWFHKDKENRYKEFTAKYKKELVGKKVAARELLGKYKKITLVTAVKDVEHSHIPTLTDFLNKL